MLKKRIIPCLDIKDGRTVKGVNFLGLKDAGDPIELAQRYSQEGADELVFLDITATVDKRKTLKKLVEHISEQINIPFTVGGGISSIRDAENLLKAGADKVSINSAAVKNPNLISEIANRFGSQCVVVAVDTKTIMNTSKIYIHGGRVETSHLTMEWVRKCEDYGAGELLLTSMNCDGTKDGFDLDITNAVCKSVQIPVIASGGAGNMEHFEQLFTNTEATGGLAASIFHYDEISIKALKQYLRNEKIAIR